MADLPPLADMHPMELDERPMRFDAPGWVWEIKYDGYRVLARFGSGQCEMRTRKGADATRWFPELAKPLAAVPGGPYTTDGEVCVLDEIGRSSFNRLQDRARRRRWYEGADPVVYCVFDLLGDSASDLTGLPLLTRKKRLMKVMTPAPASVLVVRHSEDQAEDLFKIAVHQLELEGLVAKRADSVYRPGVRSSDWVKVKRKGAVPAQRFRR